MFLISSWSYSCFEPIGVNERTCRSDAALRAFSWCLRREEELSWRCSVSLQNPVLPKKPHKRQGHAQGTGGCVPNVEWSFAVQLQRSATPRSQWLEDRWGCPGSCAERTPLCTSAPRGTGGVAGCEPGGQRQKMVLLSCVDSAGPLGQGLGHRLPVIR